MFCKMFYEDDFGFYNYIFKSKYSNYIFSRENNQFLQDAEKARKMAEEICW